MKFSEQWLREWVNPALDTQALANQLTMAGLEIESLNPAAGHFSQVVVGEIIQAAPHPKADRLRVCQVNIGDTNQLLQIVCGAPNARPGIKVAVALVGAILPNGMAIQKAKLRDVVSEGMLCSAQELGISEVSEGIIELPEDAPLGKDLRHYLNLDDIIFEVNITPNRGDCLCIAGIAREVAALKHCTIHVPQIPSLSAGTIEAVKSIHIECVEGCGAYYGRIIKNIRPQAKAPRWLADRVKRSGTRSISAVVDITNYVMYELGQPLHAFDLEKIQGNICVRLAKEQETIELLDGQTVSLQANTLVIADEAGPIALAGVMGGMRTAVTENTRHLFLESAWFSPTIIAGKARQYGLSTDAAHRYERGVDPTTSSHALERASQLILEIVGGEAGPETIVLHEKTLPQKKVIKLGLTSAERLLGVSLTKETLLRIEKSFASLGLIITSKTIDTWDVEIPAYRSDLTIEADLIEEVARIYGYHNIPSSPLTTTLKAHSIPSTTLPAEKFSETLVARGYHEIISYSFVNAEKQASLYPDSASLTLLNPISSEYADMRKGLWPGLLEAASYHQSRQMSDLRLFEIGTRFVVNAHSKHIDQPTLLSGLCMGEYARTLWNETSRPYDFYDIKGDVEALLNLTHKKDYRFESAAHPALHPGQSAKILSNAKGGEECRNDERTIGWIGALHPQLLAQWELIGPVFLFELDLNALSQTSIPTYQKLSKFPSIRRDISFILDQSIPAQALLDCISQQDDGILQSTEFFDIYQGKNISSNQKSVAIALTLQHPERTLVDTEVNAFMEKTISALENQFKIVLRQQ